MKCSALDCLNVNVFNDCIFPDISFESQLVTAVSFSSIDGDTSGSGVYFLRNKTLTMQGNILPRFCGRILEFISVQGNFQHINEPTVR